MKGKLHERLCVGCGSYKPKESMARLVDDCGRVKVDGSGKAAGRGAYVCKNADCADKAAKRKGLDKAFKRAVGKDIYIEMREYIANEQAGGVDA